MNQQDIKEKEKQSKTNAIAKWNQKKTTKRNQFSINIRANKPNQINTKQSSKTTKPIQNAKRSNEALKEH